MPRLQDVERFKRDLAALSRESEILTQWGEEREESTPPQNAVAEPPRSAPAPRGLAAKAAAMRGEAPKPTPQAAPSEGIPPDFATLLANLPLDEETGEAISKAQNEAEPGEPSVESSSPFADFDLAAFAESMGDLTEPEPEAEPELESKAEPGSESEPEAAASLPESSITDGLVDLGKPLSSLEGLEEIEGSSVPAGGDEFSIPGLGDFDFGIEPSPPLSPEAEKEEPVEPLSPEAGPETPPPEEGEGTSAGAEDFDLSGFDIPEALPAEPEEGAAGEAESFNLDDFAIPEASPAKIAGKGKPQPEAVDAFDAFNFEEGNISFGESDTGRKDLDKEIASLGDKAALPEAFNLDQEWTADFGTLGGEGGGESAPGKAAGAPAPGRRAPPPPRAALKPGTAWSAGSRPPASAGEKIRDVSLTEAQVDRLQDRLLGLPLNLRVAVEDGIAWEKGTDAQRSKLVWMLVEAAPIEEIALLAGKINERRISIPKGYEKSTGAALEAQKGTLGYALVHTFFPILRTALLVLAIAGFVGWLGWKYIYRPLAANALYRSGYVRIAEDRYPEAEAAFGKARKIQEYKSWYYRYAEAYAKKRQYILAEKKYEALLLRYPSETTAALEWASLEKDQLKYREASEILNKRILERKYLQKDALLLLGDVYLAWAEEEPKYYEEARRNYAALIQKYGSSDLYLERMLLYFMRTDMYKEVIPLKDRFMSVAKEPFPQAATLAELGGYLFDKGKLEDVNRILTAAEAKDPSLPEVHYHFARYFGRSGVPVEERKALDRAISAFERVPALSAKRLSFFIDALIRRGEFRLEAVEYLAAEEDFARAADLYGKALELRRIAKNPRFATAYAGLAEVAYWMRDDLDATLSLLEKAESHGYDTQKSHFMRGYALYRKGRFAEALEQLYLAGSDGNGSPYLDFAFGCALYSRADYYAAEGYFRRVVDAMNLELERLELPDPQGRASHEEIVELLMEGKNNLGAALYRVGNRLGDPAMRATAMAAFADSARIFDALVRDQTSMVRPDAKNLGFLNLDHLLHPKRGFDVVAYVDIPRDIRFPRRR